MRVAKRVRRCAWADHSPLMRAYHDREWGKPRHIDPRGARYLVAPRPHWSSSVMSVGSRTSLTRVCTARMHDTQHPLRLSPPPPSTKTTQTPSTSIQTHI